MVARIVSALVGIAFIFASYYFFPLNGLTVICCLVTLLSTYEYSFMVEKQSLVLRSLFFVLSYVFFLSFVFVSQSFLSFLFCFIVLSFLFLILMKENIEVRMSKLTQWLMGIIYCGGLSGVVTHGLVKFGTVFFAGLLTVSFATDTFAFIGGKLFGKHKLVPKISPNKTIEGSLFGLVGGSLAGGLMVFWLNPEANLLILGLFCLLSSSFSQVGDLFESLIKRYSGVKDSGSIMPGHGGILDRIDGLLFAGPLFYLGMHYFSP